VAAVRQAAALFRRAAGAEPEGVVQREIGTDEIGNHGRRY